MMFKIIVNTREIDLDLRDAVRDFQKLAKDLSPGKVKQMLKPAAKPIIDEAKKIVRSETWKKTKRKPHHRYKDGNIVATYYPGHLARSIKVLPFRKPYVYFGPKVTGKAGDMRGANVDAWYAHFLEWGTVKQKGIHFMQRAFESKKGDAIKVIKTVCVTKLRDWEKKVWERKSRRR
jgi:HK97 gp10 family phage protein